MEPFSCIFWSPANRSVCKPEFVFENSATKQVSYIRYIKKKNFCIFAFPICTYSFMQEREGGGECTQSTSVFELQEYAASRVELQEYLCPVCPCDNQTLKLRL